jgi:hypothetical protein
MDTKCSLLPTRKKINLQIFESKVHRKVLGPKKVDVSECIWVLCKEKLRVTGHTARPDKYRTKLINDLAT